MRMHKGRRRVVRGLSTLGLVAVGTAVAAVVVTREGGPEPVTTPGSAAAWRGLVGEQRARITTGQLSLVVLKSRSLSDRVAGAGGLASDRQERRWTAAALAAQRLFVSRMRVQGARIDVGLSFTRVLNGFAAPLDPRALALLERAPEIEGVYPVRAAYPASTPSRLGLGERAGFRPDIGLPGYDGRGVTIALLDTGVDRAQPYLRGRVQEGVDIVGGGDHGLAARKPDEASELERHGTELAGILVGADGPSGLSGIAPGASVMPIRVAGWQRDLTGAWALYSRTDQIIAGLERAVDPNDDGDAHDAARVALVGVAEPYASFASGPLARAAAGATRLDTLVVAPAGNDGPAGPGFGSISGPGGAPAALTVGAADLRGRSMQVRVVARVGLDVVLDELIPLAGSVAPDRALTLEASAPNLVRGDSVGDRAASLAIEDFFDENGFSRVADRAALVPAGADAGASVRAAASAGAGAVVLYGASVPAGALGLDERIPVPVVGIGEVPARTLLAALERGASVGVSIGAARSSVSPTAQSVAAFSSWGLAFDGRVKPELAAPGIALLTSEPGANVDGSPRFGTVHGSSAAAAAVAGAATLLAQARPDLDAEILKSILVGAARPLRSTLVFAQGAGIVDVGAAAAAELATQPSTLAFGRAFKPGWKSQRRVLVRNLSTRTMRVAVRVARRGFPAADTQVTARPRRLIIRPGGTARVRLEARVPEPARGGPPAEGVLVLAPVSGVPVRVPFAVAFGAVKANLLAGIRLSAGSFTPSDTQPSVLSLRAGRVRSTGGRSEVQPVERLDIELWTAGGKRIGVIARLRNLLPGRYAFGITGRDPGGQQLKAGVYRLRLIAIPTGDGFATRRSLNFTIK